MSVVVPPPVAPPSPDELEALIREARARQRRRRMLFAVGVALAAAVSLSAWAAVPAGKPVRSAGDHSPNGPASRSTDSGRRVQIGEMGTSGGVTWAINPHGMWLTTDGGRSWRASTPRRLRAVGQIGQRVQQVEFVDPRHGWLTAVDSPSARGADALYSTSDGGRTWLRQTVANCCGGFAFVTPERGYLSGSPFLATTDGGKVWRRLARPSFAWSLLTFADARHGIAVVGKPSRLFVTADGGRHWRRPHLPLQPRAEGFETLLAPAAVFGRTLVLPALRVPSPPEQADYGLVVYLSDDAGASWRARPMPRWWSPTIYESDPQEYFSAASASVWFAAALRKLAVTADAGRTWRIVHPIGLPTRWSFEAIDFTSAKVGWATAGFLRRSLLFRTTDGGRHWTPAGPRTPKRHRR